MPYKKQKLSIASISAVLAENVSEALDVTATNANTIENAENMYIEALGICAVNGYITAVNHAWGLCKDTYLDYNLFVSNLRMSNDNYHTTNKHLIMGAAFAGNLLWFPVLIRVTKNIENFITKKDQNLYHLLGCVSSSEATRETELNNRVQMMDILHRRLEIGQYLDQKLNPILYMDSVDNTGLPPLLWAAQQSNDENNILFSKLLDFLIADRGINTLFKYPVNLLGCSMLHYLVRRCDLENIRKVCTAAINMNIQNSDGRTALMDAVKVDVNMVKHLVSYQNRVDVNIQDNHGQTVLHLAMKANDFDMVLALCEHPDINFEIQNNKGETPLSSVDKKSIVYLLLNDVITNTNHDPNNRIRRTPLVAPETIAEDALCKTNPDLFSEVDLSHPYNIILGANFIFNVKGNNDEWIYWKCNEITCFHNCAHSWLANVRNRDRRKGTKCPYCAKNTGVGCIHKSLGYVYRYLIDEFDFAQNNDNVSLYHLSCGSHQSVHWICPFGNRWFCDARDRLSKGTFIAKTCPCDSCVNSRIK